jgi:hypothetical protein
MPERITIGKLLESKLKQMKESPEEYKLRVSSGEFWHFRKPRGNHNKRKYHRKPKHTPDTSSEY